MEHVNELKDFTVSDIMSERFARNIRNLQGTFSVENMNISKNSIKNLQRIEIGEVLYSEVIEELKLKYMQRY